MISGGCVDCQWRDRKLSDFIKKVFICVPKINESLTVLEQHEGEKVKKKNFHKLISKS